MSVQEPGIERYDVLLEGLLPDLAARISAIFQYQTISVMPLITNEMLTRAERLIVTLAISDFDDLLSDVSQGRGRAAMRSARTLIEHLINLETVLGMSTAAEN